MPVPQSAAPPTETQPLLAGGNASLYGEPSFAQHEWIRYTLPDPGSTAYYVHPGRAITTDIDLTLPENLAAVQVFLTSTHRQRDGAEEGRPALHPYFPCLDVAKFPKFKWTWGTRGIAERARGEGEGG